MEMLLTRTRMLTTLWLCFVIAGFVDGHYGSRYSDDAVLRCHDCSDKDCARLIRNDWGGKCKTKPGGVKKCFIRQDPNGLVYRGCADHKTWPDDLALDYLGCAVQNYGNWAKKAVIWCLCDHHECNVNITGVRMVYGSFNVDKVRKGSFYRKPERTVERTPVRMPVRTQVRTPTYMYREPQHREPQHREPQHREPQPRYHYAGDMFPARPEQKRVRFYKPLSRYEPLEKKKPSQRLPVKDYNKPSQHYHTKQRPSWYDDLPPSNNQRWVPPTDVRSRETESPRVFYTQKVTKSPAFTTPQTPAPVPSMSQDIGPFERGFDPNTEVEGKIGTKGGDNSPNEVTGPFDLSKIPDWLWGKIFPRAEDVNKPSDGSKTGVVDDLDGNNIPPEPVPDTHTCRSMKCEHDCQLQKGHPLCTCPAGYQLRDDARTCQDVNECLVRNGDCSHDCRNTMGSYLCACPTGYTLDVDQRTCKDFNECPKANCQHGCRNIAGTYECTCRAGYVINQDGKTCDDVNECQSDAHGCDHMCVNTVGSYTCRCDHGYYLYTNERTCRDTNECRVKNGGCEQGCRNTGGNYDCYCNRGYLLNVDGKTCDDKDECLVNNGSCAHVCWNTPGSYECRCNTGYQLDTDRHSCIDVNECRVENGGCDQVCENVKGSYRCLCRSGSSLNVDQRTCDAVDKCSQSNGGCEHVCTATPTGARCSCHPGFMLRTDARTCADINECQTNNGGCSHVCINEVGAYQCECPAGYTLNVDKATCDDVNECARNKGGCSQVCINQPGSYRCNCTTGYQLMTDGRRCEDVNECLTENGGCDQDCINTEGSYSCSCDGIIYRLHADGKRCIGTCPDDFVKNEALSSCYKVFTPEAGDNSTKMYSQDVASSQTHCNSLHPLGGLVSIQSDEEKRFVSNLLKREPEMLEGWQGWWTSGIYHEGKNLFQWSDGAIINNDSPHWGFRKTPEPETCVWVLQISVYNQTWGNYDCFTKSGHICEVELAN